jgi:replicative DNA helicase
MPSDLREGAQPVNRRAQQTAEREPIRIYTVRDLLTESVARATRAEGATKACTTGHYELDNITGGFAPGFVWVFGADTSWGKSSFIIAAADENIKAGRRVLIVSAEDPAELYADRLLVRRSRVDADRFRKKRLDPDEIAAIKKVRDAAEDVPVYCHAENKTIERLHSELTAIVRLEGIDMIVFDYLQEFTSSKKHQDERTRFKHTSQIMRDLVRTNGKSGAILSQLTINSDTKVPNKQNIRESRDVSNAAEVVAIGFTPETDVTKGNPGRDDQGRALAPEVVFKAGERYILIDKNKNGPRGKKVQMRWDEKSACFDTVHDPELERLQRAVDEYSKFTDDFDDGLPSHPHNNPEHWENYR